MTSSSKWSQTPAINGEAKATAGAEGRQAEGPASGPDAGKETRPKEAIYEKN